LLLVWQGLPQLAKRNLGQRLHPFRPLPQLVAVVAVERLLLLQSLPTLKRPCLEPMVLQWAKAKVRPQ
jgi:hypothetical protein